MSGGSMDYLCYKIEEYAHMFEDKEIINLAKDFAKLAHDCEWMHSGDSSSGRYNEAVENFKNKWFGDRNERLEKIICDSTESIKAELLRVIGSGNKCGQCLYFYSKDNDEYGSCSLTPHCLMHRSDWACENFKKD